MYVILNLQMTQILLRSIGLQVWLDSWTMIIVSSPFEREFLKQELAELSENRKQTRLSCWIVYCGLHEEYHQLSCHKCQVSFYKLFGIFTLSAFFSLPSLLCSPPPHKWFSFPCIFNDLAIEMKHQYSS